MITATAPAASVADLVGADPDLVWIARWIPFGSGEGGGLRTGVSRRPDAMPIALFGWGTTRRFSATGPDRLSDLGRQWEAWVARQDRAVAWHGFVASTFAPDSHAESVLVVPEVLGLVYADRTEWLASDAASLARVRERVGTPIAGEVARGVSVRPGDLTPDAYAAAVERALELIAAGEAGKIVLARDVVVSADDLSVPALVAALRRQSLDTWVFHIDGLVGATPELLGGGFERLFYSRVLAGSAAPDADDAVLRSAKNTAEHAFAVESVTEAIAPLVDLRRHPTAVLRLPNIVHLSTEVTGDLRAGASLLQVVEAMHPTAAICGTPTAAAARWLGEIEGFDRGRYGGPVGWVDAAGSGELALALRCGQRHQTDGVHEVRLYAGAGIVAGSDPAAEVAETDNKLRPMLGALGAS